MWRAVIAAYREAAGLLAAGERDVEFPEGTFPPRLPFVPFSLTLLIKARGTQVSRTRHGMDSVRPPGVRVRAGSRQGAAGPRSRRGSLSPGTGRVILAW